MSKMKDLQKRVGVQAGVAVAVFAVLGGVMVLTGSMATNAEERKTNAESGRTQDQGQLEAMKAQLDKSGEAERTYVNIQLEHQNEDFSTNTDSMKDWLRIAKQQYRFTDNFKLTLALDKISERPEFSAMNFDVVLREPMKLELEAISDTHVYSFIDELLRKTPGFVRMTKLELTRKNEMTDASYRQMLSGSNTDYIGAKMEFSWIGVQPKPEKIDKTPGADATAAPVMP